MAPDRKDECRRPLAGREINKCAAPDRRMENRLVVLAGLKAVAWPQGQSLLFRCIRNFTEGYKLNTGAADDTGAGSEAADANLIGC